MRSKDIPDTEIFEIAVGMGLVPYPVGILVNQVAEKFDTRVEVAEVAVLRVLRAGLLEERRVPQGSRNPGIWVRTVMEGR